MNTIRAPAPSAAAPGKRSSIRSNAFWDSMPGIVKPSSAGVVRLGGGEADGAQHRHPQQAQPTLSSVNSPSGSVCWVWRTFARR
ncbi:hypothetical protein QF037_005018 [Streptomyces canus]|nr:hypothetical protein [Streptomyces canus]